jgi:hypothetical protein
MTATPETVAGSLRRHVARMLKPGSRQMMEYDPLGKLNHGVTVPCPCAHPSHVTVPCNRPMHAGEEKCAACKDHVDSANVP